MTTPTGRGLDLVESCGTRPRMPLSCAIPDSEAVAIAAVCRAMSSRVRLRLLAAMHAAPAGEACVCDLVDVVGLSQSTMSHHLAVLVDSGLVRRKRSGTWAWYALVPEQFDAAHALLARPSALVD
ncbi:MAG: ArsR/SmtB family transcription factor [Actinophytocola sp.]|uniref:ArsR/SmtB family transcription factor n=1 Tax=Actinophytocola sp. TaxID=1872138 RepID=UPI003D6B413C